MTQSVTTYCRMGDWCASRDRNGPGADEGRGFCWQCERHGEFAIGQLAVDYATVASRIPKDAGGSGTAAIPSGRAEAPIPMNLEMEALARQIVWTVDAAETAVRERARLSAADGATRHGAAVARGVVTLAAHYSVLLALGPIAYLPYVTDESDVRTSGSLRPIPVDIDGPEFIVELTRLHHRVRSMVGLTKRREKRPLPCPDRTSDPAVRGGCSTPDHPMLTLSRELGTEVVDCSNCGWWCTTGEYDWWTMSFRVPRVAA